jgi:hypothetical protein
MYGNPKNQVPFIVKRTVWSLVKGNGLILVSECLPDTYLR